MYTIIVNGFYDDPLSLTSSFKYLSTIFSFEGTLNMIMAGNPVHKEDAGDFKICEAPIGVSQNCDVRDCRNQCFQKYPQGSTGYCHNEGQLTQCVCKYKC